MLRMGIFPLTLVGISGWLLCASAVWPDPAEPQEPHITVRPRGSSKSTARDGAHVRMDVTLVQVPVTVMDATDRPLLDLPRDSFRIFEDNVEQKIVSFVLEEGPVSVGLVFDTSGSMKTRIAASISALEQFLKTANPWDEFSLIRFSDKPSVATGFTRDPDQILSSLSAVQPEGWTALHDAICLAVQRMKTSKNSRKALLVLTDGGDNNSRYSEGEVRSLVRESDVRVYSIGISERPRLLENLAADSGGRVFWVHKLEDLPQTVYRLSREMRSEYVLGYSSNNAQNDGKYRKVRVEVMQTLRRVPLSVFWRRGYFAPAN